MGSSNKIEIRNIRRIRVVQRLPKGGQNIRMAGLGCPSAHPAKLIYTVIPGTPMWMRMLFLVTSTEDEVWLRGYLKSCGESAE